MPRMLYGLSATIKAIPRLLVDYLCVAVHIVLCKSS